MKITQNRSYIVGICLCACCPNHYRCYSGKHEICCKRYCQSITEESGISVKIITGSSGKLTQQIMSGAPYDVFLSADVEYPAKLAQGGYTTTPSQVYAYGSLVLWSDTGADLSKGVAVVLIHRLKDRCC